jgi:hypothetical protein
MARKVKFKAADRKASLQECLELALHQPRRDREGKKIEGRTIKEIQAMTPLERRHFADTVWLHQQWMRTQVQREAAYERSRKTDSSVR